MGKEVRALVVAVVGAVMVVVVAVVRIAVRVQVVEGVAIADGGNTILVKIVIALLSHCG